MGNVFLLYLYILNLLSFPLIIFYSPDSGWKSPLSFLESGLREDSYLSDADKLKTVETCCPEALQPRLFFREI